MISLTQTNKRGRYAVEDRQK